MLKNPCLRGGSCLLGSLNLSQFVKSPFTPEATFDYQALEEATDIAVRALNDVLIEGLNMHPLQEQRDSVHDWRQIGLGTLGLGDMLIKLGLKYGSKGSLEIIEKIYRTIAVEAIKTSLSLAREKGAFPKCTPAIKQAIITSDFVRNLHLPMVVIDGIQRYGLYNSQLLTCAPTGTIGTMLQVSTGVEPNYAFSYNRRTVSLNNEEQTYKVDAKIVREYKDATGNAVLPDYFVASTDINYKDRIAVQAQLQRFIDASISSTVNLPHETTVEEVADLYMLAWKSGLKGITIWRDGCQRQAILSTESKTEKSDESASEENKPAVVRQVSDDCIGLKRKLITGCGSLHLTAFFDRHTGQLLETYCSKGSTGGCALFMTGLSRMISLAARSNVSINHIVDQLKSAGTCPSYAVRKATRHDTSVGSSCPVAIGFALLDMYNELQRSLKVRRGESELPISARVVAHETESPKCPKCGEPIQMVEGCMTCASCGYSKCS